MNASLRDGIVSPALKEALLDPIDLDSFHSAIKFTFWVVEVIVGYKFQRILE